MTPEQKAKLLDAYVINLSWMLRHTPKNQAIVLRPKNEIVKVKDEKKCG